jgi:hypothetical protein
MLLLLLLLPRQRQQRRQQGRQHTTTHTTTHNLLVLHVPTSTTKVIFQHPTHNTVHRHRNTAPSHPDPIAVGHTVVISG